MNPSIPVTSITELLRQVEQAVIVLRTYDDHHLATELGKAAADVRGRLAAADVRVELRPAA